MIMTNADSDRGTDGRKMDFGGYRPVELEAPPFSLPPPVLFTPELGPSGVVVTEEGRVQGLAVWSLPFPQGGF